MHQYLKSFSRIRLSFASLVVLSMLTAHAHATTTGAIVVTIKPLYSLVAQLSDGIEKPVLLMKQMPSPHHYTMRPSDRRQLANARMIIWIGPQMESYLSKVIQQQDAITVSAIQAKGLTLLDRRSKNDTPYAFDEASHGHHAADHLDPHIWLSTDNAIAISRYISQQLTANDPKNSARYKKNLQRLTKSITRLSREIKNSLKNSHQPFITYHDAFQYFENENRLHHIDSISFNEEAGASLKHLHHIKVSIEKNNIQCLLYQPPEPDIIKTLTDGTTIKAMALDPLGLTVDNEKDAWFEIMRSIASGFKRCLNHSGKTSKTITPLSRINR